MSRRFGYILFVAFLIATLGLTRSKVLTAYADCGETQVGGDGADCGFEGSTPGNNVNEGDSSGNESGGEGSSTNNNYNSNDSGACSPGTIVDGSVYHPVDQEFLNTVLVQVNGDTSESACAIWSGPMDSCTGEFVGTITYAQNDAGAVLISSCPTSTNTSYDHPCDEFEVSGSGVTCVSDLNSSSSGSAFSVRAHAGWPGNEIHTRPYPVTLVDWDSVLREAGLGTSSGSGRLDYAPWGGGSENNPAVGDWKDVVLRLEIRPLADWADVFLENIGLLRLQIGHLYTFQWNLPSHPAAGGGPLSGQVGQLEELKPDVPLYSNWSRAPYMVYCTLEYYEWDSVCVSGPDDYGNTNCRRDSNDVFTGHREWGWYRRSQTVPVPPTAARVDAPASLLADLNGDGVPDAYWGRLSFIRRMDDAGSVNNPEWAHSYSWGAWWYWAVREGQGQIGWPGVPVDQ